MRPNISQTSDVKNSSETPRRNPTLTRFSNLPATFHTSA